MKSKIETDARIDIEFGKYLRTLRDRVELSLQEAEQESGIPRNRWMSLERGTATRSILPAEIRAASIALGVDPEQIRKKAIGER